MAMRGAEGWGHSEGTHVPSDPHSQKVLSLSQCLCSHGASGGRMGPQSPAAYLGGLKEYCMCPQELRSERQCAQRGRTERQRQEKDAKCKNRLETARHPNRSPRQPGRTAGHTRLDPPRAGEPARRAVGTGDLQASGGLGSLAPDKPGCVSARMDLETCVSSRANLGKSPGWP